MMTKFCAELDVSKLGDNYIFAPLKLWTTAFAPLYLNPERSVIGRWSAAAQKIVFIVELKKKSRFVETLQGYSPGYAHGFTSVLAHR